MWTGRTSPSRPGPNADGPERPYLADVGNNRRKRTGVQVIALTEPDPLAAAEDTPLLRPLRVLELRYPREVGPFDCEALFVSGSQG